MFMEMQLWHEKRNDYRWRFWMSTSSCDNNVITPNHVLQKQTIGLWAREQAQCLFLLYVSLKQAYLLNSNALTGVTKLANTGMKKCSSACTWKQWRYSAGWRTSGCPAARAAARSCLHCLVGTCPCCRNASGSRLSPWIGCTSTSSSRQYHEESKKFSWCWYNFFIKPWGMYHFGFKYPVEKECILCFFEVGNNVEEA